MKNCSDHGHIIWALDATRGLLVALHFEQTWVVASEYIGNCHKEHNIRIHVHLYDIFYDI